MKHLFTLLTLLCSLPLMAENRVNDVLSRLDRRIDERYIYRVEKDRKITSLKFNLNNNTDPSRDARLCHDLFEEYKTYQYDSAYLYARRVRDYAFAENQIDAMAQSASDLLYCYSTAGFFKEGAEIIDSFPAEGVSESILAGFYRNCIRYYFNLMRFVGSTEALTKSYEEQMARYTRLTLENLPESSFDYRFIDVQNDILLSQGSAQQNVDKVLELLATPNLSLNNKAILYSWLGMGYRALEMMDEAIYYTALSAISDIESCTFETTSAKVLAEDMYQEGDIDRASRYIMLAFEDANTYNSPYRKLEIQAIMPNIAGRRIYDVERERRSMAIISAVIIAMLLAIIIMTLNIHSRNVALRKARAEVEKHARELSEVNTQLSSVNAQLSEANQIKDQYIIKSLYSDSEFVENVEKISKVLSRKIRAKQYGELLDLIGGINIKQERHRMSSTFDMAFLKLFPNFIEEYNKLFEAEHRVQISESGELTPEMRIFALIRLGVEDTALISRYLNLSLNTVYVYKAKVKAKTIIPKDEFEEHIKAIKQPY